MSEVFFSATNRAYWGLYESDGTADGTKFIRRYINHDQPTKSSIVDIYGTATKAFVFSQPDDYTVNIDSYSPSGELLSKLSMGDYYNEIANFTLIGNLLYYHLYNSSDPDGNPNYIYATDGTQAGTVLLEHFTGTSFDNEVFFSHEGSPWISYIDEDGRTTTVASIANNTITPEFSFDGTPSYLEFGDAGGNFIFYNRTALHGIELWVSDGTSAGTHMLKDINRGPSDSYPAGMISMGDQVFFTADDGRHGSELWVTDGTKTGTFMLKDTFHGTAGGVFDVSNSPQINSPILGDELYFFEAYKIGALTGYHIWKTDGTKTGTEQLSMTYKGRDISAFPGAGVMNDKIFFEGFQDKGQEQTALYTYDVKTGRTMFVRDIGYGYDNINGFTNLGKVMVFSAESAAGGDELWVTDGTRSGTHQVKDINRGKEGSDPVHLSSVGAGSPGTNTILGSEEHAVASASEDPHLLLHHLQSIHTTDFAI